MPDGSTLELATLPAIHPKVSILLAYGTSTIVRLSLDPTVIPPGRMVRSVAVDWVARPGGGIPQERNLGIGWSGVPPEVTAECDKWPATKNAQDITEDAAIGVMALLIHHLEGAEIVSVLQIGSGGDYVLAIRGEPPEQAESSGVYYDPNGYLCTARLKEKSEQVLKTCPAGFASVVAFSHSPTRDVRCKLHYVTRAGWAGQKTGTRKRSKTKPNVRKKRK